MYSTDSGKPPKRAVIYSQTGANEELRTWLEKNLYQVMEDQDGLSWRLQLQVSQRPDHSTRAGLVWELKIQLGCQLTGEKAVKLGVLKLPTDERLLDLIGEEVLDIYMRPRRYEVHAEDDVTGLIAEALPNLKAVLAKSSFLGVLRPLVLRWIDCSCSFGAADVSGMPTV